MSHRNGKNQPPAKPILPDMTPEEREIWLISHRAPDNMRLVSDLELHTIESQLRRQHEMLTAAIAEHNKIKEALGYYVNKYSTVHEAVAAATDAKNAGIG